MTEYFTTSLYLYSSLLQADAAIIGLGSIFIIYKLQALDSAYQAAITACSLSQQGQIHDTATRLVITQDHQKRVEILKPYAERNDQFYPQLRLLDAIPLRTKKIKGRLTAPFVLITFHISLSAILLWLVPDVASLGNLSLTRLLGWTTTIIFIVVVVLTLLVARSMIIEDV